MDDTKFCIKCETHYPTSFFNRNKSKSDGLSSNCKKCDKERSILWQRSNRDRDRANQRDGKSKRNQEMKCKYCSSKAVINNNLCEKHWYANIAWHNLGSSSNDSVDLLMAKMEEQNRLCPYTGIALIPGINCQIDHVLPLSRFPHLKNVADNLEWVSTVVNQAKRDLTKEEFISLCNIVSDKSRGN